MLRRFNAVLFVPLTALVGAPAGAAPCLEAVAGSCIRYVDAADPSRSTCLEELQGICLKFAPAPAPTRGAATAPSPALTAQPRSRSAAEVAEAELALGQSERRDVQALLRDGGFYDGSLDGALGRGSRAAIRGWQSASGFEATGFLDYDQLKALRDGGGSAVAAAPTAAPATVAEAPDSGPPDPQPGAVYERVGAKYRGFVHKLTLDEIGGGKGRLTLDLRGNAYVLEDDCEVPLTGPFACTLRMKGAPNVNRRRIEGELPVVVLWDAGIATRKWVVRMWD